MRKYLSMAALAVAFGGATGSVRSGRSGTLEGGRREIRGAALSVSSFTGAMLGCGGRAAMTTGAASSLVGVMVAVALVPPLVVASILTVQGHFDDAGRAFLLVASNVICVNLAGVATFAVRGIRPRWHGASSRSVRIALAVWIALLVAVAVIVGVAGVAPPILSTE